MISTRSNFQKAQLYGLRIVVRPEKGFSYFLRGEFRSDGIGVDKVFAPNETCPSCKYNRAAIVVFFYVFHHAAILPYRSVRSSVGLGR
jgi:hypothetical protein